MKLILNKKFLKTRTLALKAIVCLLFLFFISMSFAKEASPSYLLKRMASPAEQTSPWFLKNIPTALDWIPDSNPENLCRGNFSEPASIANTPNPPPFKQAETFLSAQGPADIQLQGISTLEDHVVATQTGRMANADKAYIYRDKNGKLRYVHLVGHVSIEEHNYHTLATEAWLDIKKNIYHADDLLYRAYVLIVNNNPSQQPIYRNAW